MQIKKLWLLMVACCTTSSLWANDAVFLETPISYAADASVVEKVKEECRIEDMLARRIAPVLAKQSKSSGDGTVDVAADQTGLRVLRLKITHILGVGGGAWSGPKAITLNAKLLENDKLIRETRINRWSLGGVWGSFKGTCSILERCATTIAKDLAQWVKDPAFVIKEDAEPKSEQPTEPTKPAEDTANVTGNTNTNSETAKDEKPAP